jgi:hypothetical protein
VPGLRLFGVWLFLLVALLLTYSTSGIAVWIIGTAALLPAMWVCRVPIRRSTRVILGAASAVILPLIIAVIVADDAGKLHGAGLVFTGTEFRASGLAAGDAVTAVTLTSAGAPADAGVGLYPILATAPVGIRPANYAITLRPGTLAGAQVDVVAGTAHAAFIGKLFPAVKRVEHPDFAALLEALAKGEAPLIFSDGVSLAIWLNGPEGAACCAFRGGPYLDPLYFGVGVGIAVRKENPALRRALDYALARIAQRGVHAELYLKYFPVGFF